MSSPTENLTNQSGSHLPELVTPTLDAMTQVLVSANYEDCLPFPIHTDLSRPSQLTPPPCPGTGPPHHTLTVIDSQADVTLKRSLKEPVPKGEEGVPKGEITKMVIYRLP